MMMDRPEPRFRFSATPPAPRPTLRLETAPAWRARRCVVTGARRRLSVPPAEDCEGSGVMASSAASSVRPPRPKKEPQTLVIPKNAAEEQKLKLERLMKNPVRRGAPAVSRPTPLRRAVSGIRARALGATLGSRGGAPGDWGDVGTPGSRWDVGAPRSWGGGRGDPREPGRRTQGPREPGCVGTPDRGGRHWHPTWARSPPARTLLAWCLVIIDAPLGAQGDPSPLLFCPPTPTGSQDKAVPIPEKMSEWAPRPPPEFVRDVMGNVRVCVHKSS